MLHLPRNHRKTTSQCFNKEMDAQIWKIGQNTNGGSLIARLSSDYFLHGVVEDMKCHVQCSVKANRDTKKEQQPEQTNVNFSLTLKLLKL